MISFSADIVHVIEDDEIRFLRFAAMSLLIEQVCDQATAVEVDVEARTGLQRQGLENIVWVIAISIRTDAKAM